MLNNHINEDSAIMSCLCRRCELGITLNTLIYIGAKRYFHDDALCNVYVWQTAASTVVHLSERISQM